MVKSISVTDVRAKIATVLDHIAKGERVVITSHNLPVAAMVSIDDLNSIPGQTVLPEPAAANRLLITPRKVTTETRAPAVKVAKVARTAKVAVPAKKTPRKR